MQLTRYPGGLGDLAERFAAQGSLGAQNVVDFYLHLVGTKVTLTPRGEYDTWRMVNRGSRQLQASNRTTEYLIECFSYFLRLAESGELDNLSADRLESSSRDFVESALIAAAGDLRTTLLIDQAAVAARIDLARFLPPSRFVIVFRDPRDQFAEAREARKRKGRPPISVQEFAEVYRKRRRLVQKAIPRLEGTPGHRFLQVSFEEFVLDHDKESKRVLDVLELGDRERIARDFRPEVSRTNVGKYRQLIGADKSALLCAALPEFLSEHNQDRTSSTRSTR